MMRIGIIGGTGYVGGELLRLLLLHPQAEVTIGYFAAERRRIRLQRPPKPPRTDPTKVCTPWT